MSHVLTVELLGNLVKQVCSHRGYRAAVAIAGIDIRDVQQEAALAMLRASRTFNPEKGSIEDTCCTSAHRAVAHYLRRAGAPPLGAHDSKALVGTRSLPLEWQTDTDDGSLDSMAEELFSKGYYTESNEKLSNTEIAFDSIHRRLDDLLGEQSGPFVDYLSGHVSQDDAAYVLGIPPSTFYWRLQKALNIIRAEQP